MELSSQFDEIWSMVYMMQCLEIISVDEILDDEQGRVYFALAHWGPLAHWGQTPWNTDKEDKTELKDL